MLRLETHTRVGRTQDPLGVGYPGCVSVDR